WYIARPPTSAIADVRLPGAGALVASEFSAVPEVAPGRDGGFCPHPEVVAGSHEQPQPVAQIDGDRPRVLVDVGVDEGPPGPDLEEVIRRGLRIDRRRGQDVVQVERDA